VLICIAMLIFNRVYSTQFNLWFYPFLFVMLADKSQRESMKLLVLIFTLDVVNLLVYPFGFAGAYAEMGGTFGVLLARELGSGWSILFSVGIVLRALILGLLAWILIKLPDSSLEPRST